MGSKYSGSSSASSSNLDWTPAGNDESHYCSWYRRENQQARARKDEPGFHRPLPSERGHV